MEVDSELLYAISAMKASKAAVSGFRFADMRYLPKLSSFFGTTPPLTPAVSRSEHKLPPLVGVRAPVLATCGFGNQKGSGQGAVRRDVKSGKGI